MSAPRKSCPVCKGTGWATGPVKAALARADGGRVEYPTVIRCSCENSTTLPENPPSDDVFGQPKKLDAQRRAAGESEGA